MIDRQPVHMVVAAQVDVACGIGKADVADPVGSDRETYQRTARSIEEYLALLLDSLGI